MHLYQHQQQVVDENKPYFGNFRGTGSGKTRTTVAIAEGVTLVVSPKQQMLDGLWTKEWEFQGKTSTLFVVSKEQFKKQFALDPLAICGGVYPDTIILDEVHTMCGIQPYTKQKKYIKYPKTSQIFEAIVQYIQVAKPKRIHPLSATPVAQPMSVFGLGMILGKNWDYFKFRQQFYIEKNVRGRQLYLPNRSKANKELMEKTVRSIGYVGDINSFVDVPDQIFIERKVAPIKSFESYLQELKMLYPDPLVQVGKRHQLEQAVFEGKILTEYKAGAIEQYWQEFEKVIVFARYTAQIEYFRSCFSKLTKVFVLNGKTPNNERLKMMKEAEESENCIVIAQSSVSAGWEIPSIGCLIFASHSYSVVDYVQALGRIQRINNIKKNIYIDLIAGEIDSKVVKCIKNKKSFSEIDYIEKKYDNI